MHAPLRNGASRAASLAAWGRALCALLLAVSTSACGSRLELSIGRQDPDSGLPDSHLPDAPAAPFRLEWRDDFDSFDTSRWEIAKHTFEKNLADFSADNAYVENGVLKIAIRDKPDAGTGKLYTAAEVRTWQEVKYGRFVTSARLAKGAGVISAFFSFHDFYRTDSPTKDWNEIVIEMTEPAQYRFTCSHENQSVPDERQVHESSGTLTFAAPEQFHTYAFEWTPSTVRVFVDGVARPNNCTVPELINLSQRLVMSAYPTSASWADSFDPSVLPVQAEFDWVELYTYVPP
jgi:hypothetical protein